MNQTEKGSITLFEVLDHLKENNEQYKTMFQNLEGMIPPELR